MPENPAPASPPERTPLLGLSVSQLVGGSAAAATAAVLGSRLGVAGTVVGAALVSVISAVAGSLYTQSLRRTQEMLKARELLRTRELMARAGHRTRVLPTLRREPGAAAAAGEDATQEIDEAVEEATPSIWSRITWKSVAAAAAVFFLVTAVVVTGTELLTGKSLDGSSRTTVAHVIDGGSGTSRRTPTPTPTPTSTPTTTPSSTPTGTPSAQPSDTPSATTSPSATPSDTTSPLATPTPTPTAQPTP